MSNPRYHMFFEDLARLSTRAGQAKEAELYSECAEMARCSPSLLRPLPREVSRSANNMMAAGRIEADGFYIEKQGALLKRGDARCKEMKSSSRQVGSGSKTEPFPGERPQCLGGHQGHQAPGKGPRQSGRRRISSSSNSVLLFARKAAGRETIMK